MTVAEIENRFTYHAPFGDQVLRYERIRTLALSLALAIQQYCPDSREKAQATLCLQNAVMWANSAIAVNEVEGE